MIYAPPPNHCVPHLINLVLMLNININAAYTKKMNKIYEEMWRMDNSINL